jgi:hypothetical protein
MEIELKKPIEPNSLDGLLKTCLSTLRQIRRRVLTPDYEAVASLGATAGHEPNEIFPRMTVEV